MIYPVAVVRNMNQSTYETSLPIIFRGTTGESLKWIFFCPYYDSRTPHVSKHLSRGGAEGKRTRYVVRLGGSSRIIRATGLVFKSRGAAFSWHEDALTGGENLPFLSLQWGRGVFG